MRYRLDLRQKNTEKHLLGKQRSSVGLSGRPSTVPAVALLVGPVLASSQQHPTHQAQRERARHPQAIGPEQPAGQVAKQPSDSRKIQALFQQGAETQLPNARGADWQEPK